MFRQLSTRFVANLGLRRAVQREWNNRQANIRLKQNSGELLLIRCKYVTSGIQGRRNSKTPPKKPYDDQEEIDEDKENEEEFTLKDRYDNWSFYYFIHSKKFYQNRTFSVCMKRLQVKRWERAKVSPVKKMY